LAASAYPKCVRIRLAVQDAGLTCRLSPDLIALKRLAFHMLQPESVGSDRVREFVVRGGLSVWFLDRMNLTRAFELMEQYADHPMDLAGASVIAAAEAVQTRKVFTLDKANFGAYRIRRGHRHQPVDVIG
jgi:hypothetical protein